MLDNGKQFGLAYLTPTTVDTYMAAHEGHILGVVGFGQRAPVARAPEPVWVDIPALDGDATVLEVWNSSAPVSACSQRPGQPQRLPHRLFHGRQAAGQSGG